MISSIGATLLALAHLRYACPDRVVLNGIPWLVQQTNVLANEGRFLPAGFDLSTARIISRKGRDLATMWAQKDAIYVIFADNPNGPDAYELEIAVDSP